MKQWGNFDEDKLLIVNADDFGMCLSANEAIKKLLSEGHISSATVMVTCPWAPDAARFSRDHPELDVGIHLTLTSEWEAYKWGPVSRNRNVDTLTTEQGYFPPDCRTVEQYADPEQVRQELIAQIELGLKLGIEPTHLDNHMGSLYGLVTGRHFFETVFDICAMYLLPFRFPKRLNPDMFHVPAELQAEFGQLVRLAESKGVVLLDDLLGLPFALQEGEDYAEVKRRMSAILRNLQPGVTEIIIHPFYDTDELKAIMPHWRKRMYEYELFRDPDIKAIMEEQGIRMIKWRDLRDWQRKK